MEIPWQSIETEVLDRLIEELVTRDGTDYGITEKTRDQKLSEVKNALASGVVAIYWDSETETTSIVEK